MAALQAINVVRPDDGETLETSASVAPHGENLTSINWFDLIGYQIFSVPALKPFCFPV